MLDIDRIKSNFAKAIVKGCSESGCTLELADLGKHVVLKGEKIHADRKMCDCIIFVVNDSVIIGIVELKSKTVHSSEVIKKLANSSEVALNVLEKCTDNHADSRLYHIVLCKRWKIVELKNMKKGLKVRGKDHNIITKRCGVPFSTVISEFRK